MAWPNRPVHPAQRPPAPSNLGNPLLKPSKPPQPEEPRKNLTRPAAGLGAFKNKV